ncbi:DUF3859 domain-containing protein [Shewanella sediminis]|uniref:DUF3859 domain-containing protein n=1 Tax=Shewanella sediminis TaxID=271097 RepID=UPI0037D9A369
MTKATVHVPAEIDIEFGFIAQIKKAKNQKLRYCIYHPDIPDENGNTNQYKDVIAQREFSASEARQRVKNIVVLR